MQTTRPARPRRKQLRTERLLLLRKMKRASQTSIQRILRKPSRQSLLSNHFAGDCDDAPVCATQSWAPWRRRMETEPSILPVEDASQAQEDSSQRLLDSSHNTRMPYKAGPLVMVVFACLLAGSVALALQTGQSLNDGVYTDQQAMRGQALYQKRCSACHGANLAGRTGPPLTGDDFLSNWNTQPLLELA